jgi:hypothetical protein
MAARARTPAIAEKPASESAVSGSCASNTGRPATARSLAKIAAGSNLQLVKEASSCRVEIRDANNSKCAYPQHADCKQSMCDI